VIAPSGMSPDLKEQDHARLRAEQLVELRGIEPLTSSMPWKRSAN